MSILRLPAAVLVLLIYVVCSGSASACQDASDPFLDRIIPENCLWVARWSGLGDLNPDGNPTEKWLSQPEIQHSLKLFYSAIKKYQDLHPIKEAAVNELVAKLPAILQDCQASFYIGDFDAQVGIEKSGFGGVVVKLNEHEPWASEMLKKLVASRPALGVEERTIEGSQFYLLQQSGENSELHVGILQGHFLMTVGRNALENAMRDLKSPAPPWMADARKQVAVKRMLGFFHLDPTLLFELNRLENPEDRIPEFLHLEDVQSVSGSIGLDDEGFIVTAFLGCPEKSRGLLSVFDFNPIDEALISEIPDGQLATLAARISLPTVFELAKSVSGSMHDTTIDEVIGEVETLTNMDFEKEILDSFEGSFSSYQSLAALTQGGSSVLALKLKDGDLFARRLEKFNREIAGEIKALELGEWIERESQGQKIYSFNRPIDAGPSYSWCHVDDVLYVSIDDKALSIHLRKRGRTKNRLIDDPRFKNSFQYGQSRGWGKPVAVSHLDVATFIELGVPVAQTFLAGQEIPDFDFTVEDVPSVEVLTKGLEANMIVFFRGKQGFHLIERTTLPAGTVMSTGFAAGMLLPAIQQARSAARRSVTINNLRQLQFGVLNYETTHDRLPPAYTTDPQGKPLLSWRVHILPYMDQGELYDQFHLDEPWDSPHNKTLIEKMPAVFGNPAAEVDMGQTTFLGVAGEDGVFAESEGIKMASVTDGTSNTVSIVDVNSDHAVTWTAPEDFDPGEVESITDATKGNWPAIQLIAVFVDGSCQALNGYSDEELRQMMSRRDGKTVDTDR